MYKLKPGIEYHKLFKQIAKCSKAVFFETSNGDRINLKSLFSRFVFITLAADKDNVKSGILLCSREDLPLLMDYIE